MEFFLIAAVAVLWWKLARAHRRSRDAARILEGLLAAPCVVQGTLMANAHGFAYWYSGPTLVRVPLVNGSADRDQATPADLATCPDLTADSLAEIAGALEQAADDLLHNRFNLH